MHEFFWEETRDIKSQLSNIWYTGEREKIFFPCVFLNVSLFVKSICIAVCKKYLHCFAQ